MVGLDNAHWTFRKHKQRMTSRDLKAMLLSGTDTIIFRGHIVPLVSRCLGCGVYEVMKDPKALLIQQTENVQDRRQMRFTSADEITKQRKVIEAYLREAIAVEISGAKVTFKKTTEFVVPEELSRQFKLDPAFRKAFESLTPGRQRGYLLYISSAKQSSTRESRIEKYYSHIMSGKGLDDI